jgi:hypothetical protein
MLKCLTDGSALGREQGRAAIKDSAGNPGTRSRTCASNEQMVKSESSLRGGQARVTTRQSLQLRGVSVTKFTVKPLVPGSNGMGLDLAGKTSGDGHAICRCNSRKKRPEVFLNHLTGKNPLILSATGTARKNQGARTDLLKADARNP